MHGLFRLQVSFTKIQMERWNKNQVKNGLTGSNSEREHQNPNIMSDASPSTSACRKSTMKIRLRKRSNKIRVSEFQFNVGICAL